ncbi:helicase-related protein [Gynuella sunshinyii]|uniref:Lhr-like helicase n=1 Tax=Gynuella sunshinyii YC6258 TaxID=1445510 RepID=A0A0C5VPV7_9GAMM|nr:helicase-related protein [Gynuella sunshinyii]AJQ92294.1 lhr-like helicase [Gynuella sunshinyii YC6258]
MTDLIDKSQTEQEALEIFSDQLAKVVVREARGDDYYELENSPQHKFWLGRLLPEVDVNAISMDGLEQRLEPCAITVRFRHSKIASSRLRCKLKCSVWLYQVNSATWHKVNIESDLVEINIDSTESFATYAESEFSSLLHEHSGLEHFSARLDLEVVASTEECWEISLSLVNCGDSSRDDRHVDTRLYEAELSIHDIDLVPYEIEALPDSYRYNRFADAYGTNCGVVFDFKEKTLTTSDVTVVDRHRPDYWGGDSEPPNLRFDHLQSASNVLSVCRNIIDSADKWRSSNWSKEVLRARSEHERWTDEMLSQAVMDSSKFDDELSRLRQGLVLLESNSGLLKSIIYMNTAMEMIGTRKGYTSWRPFQFSFLLANLSSIINTAEDSDIVDVVWFATGGGKTETYLGLLVTAMFHDRLTGKSTGITAWTRFPLRMLSLQQTQRFADAIAAAEIVRSENHIDGDEFSLGFFIGSKATPNRIYDSPKKDDPSTPNINDPSSFNKYSSVLEKCPFCGNRSVGVKFDRVLWKTDLFCKNTDCIKYNSKIPIHIVDHEIYRFLPTIVVGTLDKAAQLHMNSGMSCFTGAPWGICSEPGHGHTYAPRSDFRNGCLVWECNAQVNPLPMPADKYPPRFRLQDELHLLRDSLGAVDSHYESLYDHLSEQVTGGKSKILASSATLNGYEKQTEELYMRGARLFPSVDPKQGQGLWSTESNNLMRKYIGIAPRGLTLEWVTEQIVSITQSIIREMISDPSGTCSKLGVDEMWAELIINLYGTELVYGNTLRDIEAVNRSGELQQLIANRQVNWESLTSKVQFDEVSEVLKRLQSPEDDFYERIHAITASSMISHGVDVDRLNLMIMMGLPLGTSDFIQATARVGRRYPGIVFVVHKIARERDAQVYRLFENFVNQADRFVEPIPITRKSKRVLSRTLSGIALSRITAYYEKISGRSLQSTSSLRNFVTSDAFDVQIEIDEITKTLGFTGKMDASLRSEVASWYQEFINILLSNSQDHKFPSDCIPGGEKPMLSLRDVDSQVPIFGRRL